MAGNIRAKKPARARPKNLNLITIHLPLPALVSILHRVSGVLLFLLIPLLLAVLQDSLRSADDFSWLSGIAGHSITKLLLLGVAWAYLYHFCAGLRHITFDFHCGAGLVNARYSSMLVLAASLILTVLIGIRLW